MVVTKGQPPEKIRDVVKAGASNLGENYPEETRQKIDELQDLPTIQWHMIGHLQSRKIKMINPTFSLIHSVDSLELAAKLDVFFGRIHKICDILIEVNVSGEATKYGFTVSDEASKDYFFETFERIKTFSNIKVHGLMTMPPLMFDEGPAGYYFDRCRILLEEIQTRFGDINIKELSMGTSHDFSTAIRCGATFVRVGEAIMGPRTYRL